MGTRRLKCDIEVYITMNNDSNNIIISIKPVYAELILDGRKKYEFRKCGFTRSVVKSFIYSTKPVNKILGYFTFNKVLRGKTSDIWEICSEQAGITEEDYIKYYKMYKNAFAIKIDHVFRLNKPINPFDEIKGFKSPRSFIYISKGEASSFIR